MKPSYIVAPYIIPESGDPVPGIHAITEKDEQGSRLCCKIHVSDSLNDILKRGIPYEEAKRIHHEIQTA